MPRSSATRSTPTAMPYMIPQQGRSTYAPFSSKAVQETTRHSDQLFKRQGQGNTLFALSSFRATRILKKKGGKNSKIDPDWFLLNRIQFLSHTHTRCAEGCYVQHTVPFHPCHHRTNNPEKNQSPTCSSYTHSKERGKTGARARQTNGVIKN